MAYCPLCLADLRATASDQPQLYVYSSRRGQIEGPFAPDRARLGERDAFVQHVRCAAKNPFWAAGSVGAAGEFLVTHSFTTPQGQPVHVDHKILGVLESVQGLAPGRDEMWYPADLFKAVNGRAPFSRRQCISVKLVGGPEAGKTVLSTIAMLSSSYPHPTCTFRTEDFVYAPKVSDFLSVLHPIDCLSRGRAVATGWALPTVKDTYTVRAVFRIAQHKGVDGEQESLLRQSLRLLRSGNPQDCLIFYDTSGEDAKRYFADILVRLDRKMNVLAVVLDATDLAIGGGVFGTQQVNSVPIALEQLSRAPRFLRPCLLLTKLDILTQRLRGSDATTCSNYLDQRRATPMLSNAGDRDLLMRWLRQHNNDFERQLANLLSSGHAPVFFTWTDGAQQFGPGTLPQAHGLTRFADWCFRGE